MSKKCSAPRPAALESTDAECLPSMAEAEATLLADFRLQLGDFREDVERGDGAAILQAMNHCALSGQAAPTWLASAFAIRLDRFLGFYTRTLDEAFGVKRKKGLNLPAARKRRAILFRVDGRFSDLRQEGHSAELARQMVAAEFNVSQAKVKDYIGDLAARYSSPSPGCDCAACSAAKNSENK